MRLLTYSVDFGFRFVVAVLFRARTALSTISDVLVLHRAVPRCERALEPPCLARAALRKIELMWSEY